MRTRTQMCALAGLFAALTAVGAFLRLPLGAMSLTLQFFFTALAGVLLGPRWGAVSQAVYVALGLTGLPVFTMGGGPGYLLQPSFGFLLGLIPAAWTVGRLSGGKLTPLRLLPAALAGLGALYLVGLPYLYLILNVYLEKGLSALAVVESGMLIYLPGDCLKIAALTVVAPPLRRALAGTTEPSRPHA